MNIDVQVGQVWLEPQTGRLFVITGVNEIQSEYASWRQIGPGQGMGFTSGGSQVQLIQRDWVLQEADE